MPQAWTELRLLLTLQALRGSAWSTWASAGGVLSEEPADKNLLALMQQRP